MFKVAIGMHFVPCNTNFVQVYVVPTITDLTVHATPGSDDLLRISKSYRS